VGYFDAVVLSKGAKIRLNAADWLHLKLGLYKNNYQC